MRFHIVNYYFAFSYGVADHFLFALVLFLLCGSLLPAFAASKWHPGDALHFTSRMDIERGK